MKKKFQRRSKGTPQELIDGCFNCLGMDNTPFFSQKRGKHLKSAQLMMAYGASVRNLQKRTGLSLRRLNVLRKQMMGSKKARVFSHKPQISDVHDEIQVRVTDAMAVRKELLGEWETTH